MREGSGGWKAGGRRKVVRGDLWCLELIQQLDRQRIARW